MARIEVQLGPLAERKQTHRQRGLAIDSDESLRTDEIAGRAEERVTPLHGAHLDTVHPAYLAPKQRRIHLLDASAVGAETLVSDDERQGDRVDPKDQWPFLRDDMEQRFDAFGLNRGDHRFVDRGDGARMTAGKGDQILVCLLGSTKTAPEMHKSAFFEGYDRCHCRSEYARSG